MRITPADILYYTYCPYLLEKDPGKTKLIERMDLFNTCLVKSIVDAEKRCLMSDSELTPRKLVRSWDKIWWPEAVSNGIPLDKTEKESVRASRFMSDYCKYDISGYMFPTVATSITTQRTVGTCTLHSGVDMIKVDLNNSKKNLVLVDFSLREMSERELAIDTYNMAKAYSFYSGRGETVTYTHIRPGKNKLHVSSAIFRPEQMKQIDTMVKHVVSGISKNIRYMNRWNCQECKLCPNFKY